MQVLVQALGFTAPSTDPESTLKHCQNRALADLPFQGKTAASSLASSGTGTLVWPYVVH